MGVVAATQLREQAQRVGTVESFDVHDLAPVEHADLHGLAALVAQVGHREQHRFVEAALRRNGGGEVEQREAEAVAAGGGILLEEAFVGERAQDAVDRRPGLPDRRREVGDAPVR